MVIRTKAVSKNHRIDHRKVIGDIKERMEQEVGEIVNLVP